MRGRVLLLPMCAFATLADAATLARLRAFVRETQTMHANFTQVVVDANGRQVAQASGQFSIARPGRFRWTVEKPYKQLLVGDGDRVWIYDQDLNQVISRKSDRALGNTPAALLSGREEVEEDLLLVAIKLRMTGRDLARPVVTEPHAFELGPHRPDVLVRPNRRMDVFGHRRVYLASTAYLMGFTLSNIYCD